MPKTVWKGSTLLAPVPPTMVTCGDFDNANILTVAWTGIINSQPPKTYISVRPERYSHGIIGEKKEFVINLTPASLARVADFCGIKTGRKVDKFEKCKLTKEKASVVSCPVIAECPLSIECRVTDIIPLGSHDMFIADIVSVDVEESLLDEEGKLRMDKANLSAYIHGDYFAMGKKIGSFGYSVRKKRNTRKS